MRGDAKMRLLAATVLVAAATILAISGTTGAVQGSPEATPIPEPVTRDVLVDGMPDQAPGQILELVRYTIQSGVTLPAHTHPGMQIAWIESGILHYVVVEGGSIPIMRGSENGAPGPVEQLGPGQETDLHPGDSVVEIDGVVHYGANLGDEPVVILASTLLDESKPAAEVIATPVTG